MKGLHPLVTCWVLDPGRLIVAARSHTNEPITVPGRPRSADSARTPASWSGDPHRRDLRRRGESLTDITHSGADTSCTKEQVNRGV